MKFVFVVKSSLGFDRLLHLKCDVSSLGFRDFSSQFKV
jgi:hypothetical protein